jgi:hypothetical protein
MRHAKYLALDDPEEPQHRGHAAPEIGTEGLDMLDDLRVAWRRERASTPSRLATWACLTDHGVKFDFSAPSLLGGGRSGDITCSTETFWTPAAESAAFVM